MALGAQLVTKPLTIKATVAISKGILVGYNGAACAAKAKAIGVAYYDAAAGEPITVFGPGNVVHVVAGAAITAGAVIESDANGKAVPLDNTTPGKINGVALEGASTNATFAMLVL